MINIFIGKIQKRIGASYVGAIFKASVRMALLTVITNTVIMLKDLMIAGYFGVSRAVDAYLIALLIPMLVNSIISGALNSSLIPIYISVKKEHSEAAAEELLSNIIVLIVMSLIALSAIFYVLSSYCFPLLASRYEDEDIILIKGLYNILVFTIPLSGISSVCLSVLNAEKKFFYYSITPTIVPVMLIIFLFVQGPNKDISLLAYGILFGTLLQMIFCLLFLYKANIKLKLVIKINDCHLHKFLKQFLPAFGGVLVMSGSPFIDQTMAALFAPGRVSVLSYAGKISSLINSIGLAALGTAIFPYFSTMVAERKWEDIKKTLMWYIKLVFIITVPIVIMINIFSLPIIKVLFARGVFGTSDSILVANAQRFISIQLPFYVAGGIAVKLLSAFYLNNMILWIASINFVLNIVFNIVLSTWLGIDGIALSTSLVYMLSFSMIMSVLHHKFRNLCMGNESL